MNRDQHIAIGESISELCNPEADIYERIIAADRLRTAFGLPIKHKDDCKIAEAEEPDATDCTCDYWDAIYPADMGADDYQKLNDASPVDRTQGEG